MFIYKTLELNFIQGFLIWIVLSVYHVFDITVRNWYTKINEEN